MDQEAGTTRLGQPVANQPNGAAASPAVPVIETLEASAIAGAGMTTASPAVAGRPKGKAKRMRGARPTHASPEGPPLVRDSSRVLTDAIEMQQNPKKSTSSNRLGGGDLRVVRDNIDELTGKTGTRAYMPLEDSAPLFQ